MRVIIVRTINGFHHLNRHHPRRDQMSKNRLIPIKRHFVPNQPSIPLSIENLLSANDASGRWKRSWISFFHSKKVRTNDKRQRKKDVLLPNWEIGSKTKTIYWKFTEGRKVSMFSSLCVNHSFRLRQQKTTIGRWWKEISVCWSRSTSSSVVSITSNWSKRYIGGSKWYQTRKSNSSTSGERRL